MTSRGRRALAALRKMSLVERTLGLAMLAAFMLLRIWNPAPLEVLQLKTFDFYQKFAPRAVAQLPVAIIDIDEQSLEAYGQWPWPRTRLAELVNKATAAGAVTIAFDVVFAEPDRLSPDAVAATLEGLGPAAAQELRRLPSSDKVFAEAIRNSRVVLGQTGALEKKETNLSDAAKLSPVGVIGGEPDRYLTAFPGLIANLPVLEEAAMGRGLFSISPDWDGTVRRVPLIMKAGGIIKPALSIELLRVATGSEATVIRLDQAGIRGLVVAKVAIPTDANGRLWIRYSPHSAARFVPARAVLDGTLPDGALAGKLVLVGTSALGLFDTKTTPLDPAMPGVELQAQVVENILSKAWLHRPGNVIAAELFLALFVGLAVIGMVPVLGAAMTLLTGAIAAVIVASVSGYLYTSRGILFDGVYPLLSSFVIFSALSFLNYFNEERRRRSIRSAFGQYLSPTLVDQLARDPSQLVLGGETKELTVLFSDVRGFTSIAELYRDDPQGLTSLMNRLLTPLSRVIVDRRGTIDKYMGDNVMAFWNAPLPDTEHALNACRAALAMLAALEELNGQRKREAVAAGNRFIPLDIGIGINTGVCIVGNMGSDLRFDYSVLGDAVNLASRLEGQAKTYQVPIIVGSRTAELVQDKMALIRLDRVRVKGKLEPETIYSLLGDEEVLRDKKLAELNSLNEQMMESYVSRDWKRALAAASGCRDLAVNGSLKGFYDVYEERIRAFRANPPPKDWDGVFIADTK
jgi:adenylate cyclase